MILRCFSEILCLTVFVSEVLRMSSAMRAPRAAGFAAAALAVITFLVYVPALGNGFVNWDDPAIIYENPLIRALDLKGAFTAVVLGNWIPLTFLSYAMDYMVWGKNPLGYHLTANALHSLNAGLVFLIALRLACVRSEPPGIRHYTIAAVGAVLFSVHPAHVESVAWLAERKDVLYAFFFLLSVLAYLKYSSSSSGTWYVLSLLFFILSLLSKPMAVTLPAVLLILDWFPLGRLRGRLLMAALEKAPFFALSAAASVVTVLAQRSGGAVVPMDAYPLWMRAAVAVRALGFYVFKTIFPAGLAPYYPLPSRGELLDMSFYGSFALTIAVIALSVIVFRRTKGFCAAWLYYAVTLLPVIGIVQTGGQAAADRYTYLPLLGPFFMAGAGAGVLVVHPGMRRAAFYGVIIAGIVLSFALVALTVRQIGFWRDSLTLWNRQLEVYPGRVSHAYNMRGLAYDEKRMYREAVADFTSAIALNPSDAYAFNNRGNAHRSLGNFGRAIEDFKAAALLSPNLPEPHHNLSGAYSAVGEMELAAESAKKARELGWGSQPGR